MFVFANEIPVWPAVTAAFSSYVSAHDVSGSKYAAAYPPVMNADGMLKHEGSGYLSLSLSLCHSSLGSSRLPPSSLRALYDRTAESELDLTFKKDDILYVDDTLPKGNFGTWMAWQLDENAQTMQRGQIPSKYM